MKSRKRPRLQAVQAGPEFTLSLTFVSGRSFVLDMSRDVHRLPGLALLQSADAFAAAALGEGGWTVEWPQLDIQIGADTLYLDALAQGS